MTEESKEIERLRWMIRYALDGPDDADAIKSVLFDALNGCSGADNLDAVRAKFGRWEDQKAEVLP